MAIVNDLASYEMEFRRFITSKAHSLINIVEVIERIEKVTTTAAKSLAYAMQLCIENEILEELKAMNERDELSAEERRWVDGCLVFGAGNVLCSTVMSRYGGEESRIA